MCDRSGGGKRGPRKGFYTRTGRKLGQKGYVEAPRFWGELAEELKEEEQSIRKVVPQYKGD